MAKLTTFDRDTAETIVREVRDHMTRNHSLPKQRVMKDKDPSLGRWWYFGTTATSQAHPTYPSDPGQTNADQENAPNTFVVEVTSKIFDDTDVGYKEPTNIGPTFKIIAQNVYNFYVPIATEVVVFRVPSPKGPRWWFIPIGTVLNVLDKIKYEGCAILGRERLIYSPKPIDLTDERYKSQITLHSVELVTGMSHTDATAGTGETSDTCKLSMSTGSVCLFEEPSTESEDLITYEPASLLTDVWHETGDGIYGTIRLIWAPCTGTGENVKLIDTVDCSVDGSGT